MTRLVVIGGALVLTTALLLMPDVAEAATSINLDLGDSEQEQVGSALKMLVLLTVLSLAPAILLTTTSFIRVVVVLSFLRSALGTQNTPPQQVLIGLALFLSIAIMAPVATEVYEGGVRPYLDGEVDLSTAYETGAAPLRNFMLAQTREKDLALFYEIGRSDAPDTVDDVAMHLLVPAFVISELRTAFEMGFLLFIPFLLLDLIVASVTMALGLVMMPPALISLPLKIMLFVLADGWNLLVGSLVGSFA